MSIEDNVFHLKAGNVLPLLRATLYGPSDTPQNLAGATVRLHVRAPDGTIHFDRPVTAIEDEPGGVVRYDWIAGDTDTPGRYRAEFQATLNGAPVTYPNDRDLVIVIAPNVGGTWLLGPGTAVAALAGLAPTVVSTG